MTEFEAIGPELATQQVKKKKKRLAAMQFKGFTVLQILMKKLSW
jgi:hypothetical protein